MEYWLNNKKMKVNGSDTQHSDTFPLGVEKGRQKNIYFEKKQKCKSEEMLLVLDGPTV